MAIANRMKREKLSERGETAQELKEMTAYLRRAMERIRRGHPQQAEAVLRTLILRFPINSDLDSLMAVLTSSTLQPDGLTVQDLARLVQKEAQSRKQRERMHSAIDIPFRQ